MEDFFAGVCGRWPAGREDYHWLALPGPQDIRETLVRPYHDLTHREGLAPVLSRQVHITVQHVAPVGEISGAEMARIAGLVRGECAGIAPFTITAARAEIWGSGVVCRLRPETILRRLWEVTTGAGREVTGDRFEVRPSRYVPHLALAYAVGHLDDRTLRRWICDCGVGEVTLAVAALTLVAQKHDGREISWRLIDEIPLGGTRLS